MPASTPNSPEAGVEIDVIEIRGRRAGGFWTDDASPYDPVLHPNGYIHFINRATGDIVDIAPSEYNAKLHDRIYDLSDDLNFGVHWDGYSSNQNSIWATLQPNGDDNTLFDGLFHTYGLLWTPDEYVLYYDGVEILRIPRADDTSTPDFDEGWLSSEKNSNDAKLITYTYPKSGRPKSNYEASDEKAISQALQHLILSVEVRDPNFGPQDNWVGPLYELGPQGDPANTKMVVDSVRVYEMKSLQAIQTPAQPNVLGASTFINAENYDNGGQGIAFMDRYDSGPDAVFTQAEREAHTPQIDIADFGSGDYYIQDFEAREWVEYTVTPGAPGYYAVSVDAGNPAIDYPTSKEDGKARTSLLFSADHDGLGSIIIDASTQSGAGKIRRHALPVPVGIFCPTIMNIQALTNSDVLVEVDSSTTTYIDLETYVDGLQFDYLGNVIDSREAETATLTGSISRGDGYLTNFNNAGEARFANLPGWDGEAAKLLIRYSVVDNGSNTPFLKVRVNNAFVQDGGSDLLLTLQPDNTLYEKGYERSYYRYVTVDIPAGMLTANSTSNTLDIVSDGSSNEEIRIDWIALASEIDLPAPVCNCCSSGGETVTLEAEDGTLIGGAFQGSDAGASGGYFVNGLWSIDSAVEWSVTAASAGDATLSLTYAYDSAGNTTTRSFIVNGTEVADLTLDGDNPGFTGVATATVALNTGANTIWIGRLANDGGGAVKFDVLDVQLPGSAPVASLNLTVEAEATTVFGSDAYTTLVGDATIGTHANANGGAYVDGLNKSFTGVEFNLGNNVPAGNATLTIRYANGGSATVTKALEVNTVATDVDFPVTGSWNTFQEITLPADITLDGDGSDVLRIWRKYVTAADTGSLRIDSITLQN
ncbi:CBM35 domain-containing protein [Cerasicoccus fimbriatus]|uniref:CBM35 domain-containing protein n=1 Tax=Cerasicoccus fimbriatus TaxID=3014554 RepID=UPI0022B2E649|nr:CBM35 domain-containing protein [Cerasicoccus sp. TK19100]